MLESAESKSQIFNLVYSEMMKLKDRKFCSKRFVEFGMTVFQRSISLPTFWKY